MKTNDFNKKRRYAKWLERTGNGAKRLMKPVSAYAREQMARKPYGGSPYEQKHPEAGTQDGLSCSAGYGS